MLKQIILTTLRFGTILFFITIVILMNGCESSLTVRKMQAKNPLAKNSPKIPTKMVDVWNTYAQTTPEGKALRGIAGRIHFYNDNKKKQTVKVDGDLTVFVFDGKEKDPAHAKPLKVYLFKSETLDKHYAYKKPLGHGYDFFLPFDEIGGEEKNLCVMTRFDDRLEKTLLVSHPVNTILSGTKREPVPQESAVQEFLANNSILMKTNREMTEKALSNDIRQVGFEQEKEKQNNKEIKGISERNVTTIQLNDPLTRRLAHPSNFPEVNQSSPVTTIQYEPVSSTAIPAVLPQQMLSSQPERSQTATGKSGSRYQIPEPEIASPATPF